MPRYLNATQLARFSQAARIQEDVDVPDTEFSFRVQALTQEQFAAVRRRSRDAEADNGIDDFKAMAGMVAFGLVEPDLIAEHGIDGAIEAVREMPMSVVSLLAERIGAITNRPASEAFKELFGEAGSLTGSEGSASLTLISANGLASPIPDSSLAY